MKLPWHLKIIMVFIELFRVEHGFCFKYTVYIYGRDIGDEWLYSKVYIGNLFQWNLVAIVAAIVYYFNFTDLEFLI